jgi:hypothetical protein
MIKVGGTFKFASEYFSKAQLMGVASATYTGTAKNVNLTVSHGQVGFDTNVPSGVTWDGQSGTVGKDAVGDITDPSFTFERAFHTETWWVSSNGGQYHRDQDVRNAYAVTATAILGDETGNVVGWSLTMGAYVSFEGAYSGAPFVGYTDDGGAFAGFAGHVQTATEFLKMNGTTLQSKITLQSDTRPAL